MKPKRKQRRSLRGRVRPLHMKSLNDMGIKTEEDYWHFVNDCLAGHAAIYR